MKVKLVLMTLLCCAFLSPAEAMNWEALRLYGDGLAGNVLVGATITKDKIMEKLEGIDISPEDLPLKKTGPGFYCSRDNMERYFKDESGETQTETINNFWACLEEVNEANQYALRWLIQRIEEKLQ